MKPFTGLSGAGYLFHPRDSGRSDPCSHAPAFTSRRLSEALLTGCVPSSSFLRFPLIVSRSSCDRPFIVSKAPGIVKVFRGFAAGCASDAVALPPPDDHLADVQHQRQLLREALREARRADILPMTFVDMYIYDLYLFIYRNGMHSRLT